MVNHKALAPGLYIQRGDEIKSLELLRELFKLDESPLPEAADDLAKNVGWVFVATEVRREHIAQIPHDWRRNDDDLDAAPFEMRALENFKQIDEALQLFSRAYLFKARNGSGKVVYVRWLDPRTIEPLAETATAEAGVQFYRQTLNGGGSRIIPATDIISFVEPGMGEIAPRQSAVSASRIAAQVAYGIGATARDFFEGGGLPVMMVKVGRQANPEDVSRIRSRFERVFNRTRGWLSGGQNYKTIGVTADVEVVPISLAPKDLEMSAADEDARKMILAAHRVPRSIALGESNNRSVSEVDMRSLITTMGSRLEYIASVLNTDPDFMKEGYSLNVRTAEHWAMKQDESAVAQAFSQLLSGMTPEAAGYWLGITPDKFPVELQDRIFLAEKKQPEIPSAFSGDGSREQQTAAEESGNEQAENEKPDAKAAALNDLAKWERKSLKSLARNGSAAVKFETDFVVDFDAAMLDAMLDTCGTAEEVKQAFAYIAGGYYD